MSFGIPFSGAAFSGTVDSNIEQGTGGVLIAGDANVNLINYIDVSGGILIGGAVSESLFAVETGTAGTLVAGAVFTTDVIAASGGLLLSATAIDNIVSTGGILISGSVPTADLISVSGGLLVGATAIDNIVSTGGILTNGFVFTADSISISGGLLVGGDGICSTIATETSDGGTLIAGVAVDVITGTGGVLFGGSIADIQGSIIGSGGVIIGEGIESIAYYTPEISGGIEVGGIALVDYVSAFKPAPPPKREPVEYTLGAAFAIGPSPMPDNDFKIIQVKFRRKNKTKTYIRKINNNVEIKIDNIDMNKHESKVKMTYLERMNLKLERPNIGILKELAKV